MHLTFQVVEKSFTRHFWVGGEWSRCSLDNFSPCRNSELSTALMCAGVVRRCKCRQRRLRRRIYVSSNAAGRAGSKEGGVKKEGGREGRLRCDGGFRSSGGVVVDGGDGEPQNEGASFICQEMYSNHSNGFWSRRSSRHETNKKERKVKE